MALIEALMQGPVGITVAASGWSSYSSGVFNDCDPTVNHAVLLMGYGKDESTKYPSVLRTLYPTTIPKSWKWALNQGFAYFILLGVSHQKR